METDDAGALGHRLRARRTAAGRTIASVAVQAGLSVPYIANLENGRGNPTLAALRGLARALGADLRVELHDGLPSPPPVGLPDTLRQFARLHRFVEETRRLAAAAARPEAVVREEVLAAMAATGATSPRDLAELDWHRILDVMVLIARA